DVAIAEPRRPGGEEALDRGRVGRVEELLLPGWLGRGGSPRDRDRAGARPVQRCGEVGAEAAGAADDECDRAGEVLHQAYERRIFSAGVPGVVSSPNASAASRGWNLCVTTLRTNSGEPARSSIAAGKSLALFRVPTSVSSFRVMTISGRENDP